MIALTIPEASPSLNLMRKHWTHLYSLRKHWSMLVWVAKNEARVRDPEPLPWARVKIIRVGRRNLDTDNFVGGLKCLIDGLREQRLIVDDSPDHLELVTEQRLVVRGGFPRTLIEINGISG